MTINVSAALGMANLTLTVVILVFGVAFLVILIFLHLKTGEDYSSSNAALNANFLLNN